MNTSLTDICFIILIIENSPTPSQLTNTKMIMEGFLMTRLLIYSFNKYLPNATVKSSDFCNLVGGKKS